MRNYFLILLMLTSAILSGSDTIWVKGTVFYQTVMIGEGGFTSVQPRCGDIEISSNKATIRFYDDHGGIYTEESFTMGDQYVEESDHLAYICRDNLGKKVYFHMWISSVDKRGLGYTINRPFYKETTLFVIDPGDRVDFNYKTGRLNGGQRLHQYSKNRGRVPKEGQDVRPVLVRSLE